MSHSSQRWRSLPSRGYAVFQPRVSGTPWHAFPITRTGDREPIPCTPIPIQYITLSSVLLPRPSFSILASNSAGSAFNPPAASWRGTLVFSFFFLSIIITIIIVIFFFFLSAMTDRTRVSMEMKKMGENGYRCYVRRIEWNLMLKEFDLKNPII